MTPKQPIPSCVHADDFTADARTVLPGQPVGYHGSVSWRTPIGICIGAPIDVQTDPSKIVGVLTNEPQPEPELPPIPESGFYWARLVGADRWEPVEVYEAGHRRVDSIGIESNCDVLEWGPKLEPPGTTPSRPFLTYAEVQLLKGALGAALLPAPFGGEPEVSRKLTGEEHVKLVAAIARVTVQPAECTHDAWEWPMARCPGCGAEKLELSR